MQGMGESADHALHPGLTSRYRIIRLLGSGGMGHVYLAMDQELARYVAVKTIRPDLARDEHVHKRIDVECRLHAAIGMQPNIVALHDRIELDGFVYLILEYVDGILLSELLESEKSSLSSVGLAEKVAIIIQILTGLQAIHQKNILHRDIKPANVMVCNLHSGHPVVKLMDFGIAHAESEEDALSRLTVVDSGGPGTPTYMAPERIDPQTFGEIGVAADLYSVGVILFQMLSDGPPFRGTVTDILVGHLTKSIDYSMLRPGLPPGLREVLVRSLQKKQADRFRDAGAFAEALRRALLPVAMPAGHDLRSEETLLATDPRLMAQEGRTLLDTKAHLKLPAQTKWRRSIFAAGAAFVLLLVASLLVVHYFDLLPITPDNRENQPIVKETPAADGPEVVQPVQEAPPPGEDRQEAAPRQETAPEASDGSQEIVDAGSDSQKAGSGASVKKQSSAMDAFNSARTVKVEEHSPERVPNPFKTNENRKEHRTENSPSKKNYSSTPVNRQPPLGHTANCRSLRESYQLGDPSISPQYLKKVCAQ